MDIVGRKPIFLVRYDDAGTRNHKVTWHPDRWRAGLAGTRSLAIVEKLATETTKDGTSAISREYLLASPTKGPSDRLKVFIGAMIWGRVRGGTTTLRSIDEAGSLDRALAQVSELLGTGRTIEALASILPGGPNALPKIGPSFATKILYFLGYRRDGIGLSPLIFDNRVARMLTLHGWDFWSPLDAEAYEHYLRLSSLWNHQLGRPESEVHAVEFALFRESPPPEDVAMWRKIQLRDLRR